MRAQKVDGPRGVPQTVAALHGDKDCGGLEGIPQAAAVALGGQGVGDRLLCSEAGRVRVRNSFKQPPQDVMGGPVRALLLVGGGAAGQAAPCFPPASHKAPVHAEHEPCSVGPAFVPPAVLSHAPPPHPI